MEKKNPTLSQFVPSRKIIEILFRIFWDFLLKNKGRTCWKTSTTSKNEILHSTVNQDSGRRVDLRCIEVWQKTDNIDFIRFSFFVQEADLGLDDLTVTSQRSQVVDFSAPYETSTLEVMLQVCSTHYAPTIFYTLSKEKVWKWSSLN